MAVSPGPTLVIFILICFGLLNSSPLDSCPDFCTCEQFLQPNCSSVGLSSAPQNLHTSVSALDLSNNQLGASTFKSKYYSLQKVWLGNNSITHLSLCLDLYLTNRGRSRLRRSFGPWRRSGCLLWAPTLQLLSVERNQLQTLPEGLGQQRELHILNLSFNKISKMEPEDFVHLKQLEELHLQNNLIAFLQPQIFEKLDKLKVLDLSFNLLTTLHPSTYVSLRDFGTDVALRGNSWICDCNMRVLQRGMAVDRIRGLKTWSIECASPLSHSGMNLLELQELDFKCPDQELHEDITVHEGSRILLACSESDAVWWTPSGQTTGSQDEGGLLITDITEQHEGLYVCVSHSSQILSVFNVQIREKTRKSRSVSREAPYNLDKMVQTRNTVTQSHFAMAVSLSVIITFIVAFILGVLLQPYICACWQKARTRKQKPQTTPPVANARQEQYDNEAYLHCEDVDDFEPHRERRVTFTEYTEEGNMQYYDTVAGDAPEANGAVAGRGQASLESSDESGSEDGERNRENVNNLGKKIHFEHIPDSTERNSLSSQSSNSSKEDKILKNCSTPNTSQTTEERIQKTEVATIEVSQIEHHSEIPGFSSEPFADWSPHQHGSSLMSPDLDNGEPFEFSDSVRSGSPVSPSSFNGSFKQSNLLVPNVNKKIRFKSSSSSSEMSDGEPTQYTVNADSEEEAEVFEQNSEIIKSSQIVKSSSSSSESETESHHAVETRPVVDLASKEMTVKNELQNEEQTLPHIEQKPPTPKRRAPLPPPRRKPSSSSSDSEDEMQKLKQANTQLATKQETKTVHFEQQSPWPVVDLESARKVKRRLDFKVQYAAYASFSSDSEDERIYEEIKEEDGPKLPIYSKQESLMATQSQSNQFGTSSSSESEEEQENYYEDPYQEQENYYEDPYQEQENYYENTHQEQENYYENIPKWPVVTLVKIPKVNKRLDFKMAVPTVEASSSSNSEDEQFYVNVTQVQGKVPLGVVNVSKPGSGTSSSSESEDEREIKVKVNKENLQQTSSPIKPTTAVKLEDYQWPAINLVRIPKVKRRLDIKERVNITVTQASGRVPSTSIKVPKYGTSSSSESEDEREVQIVNKEHLLHTAPPTMPPSIESPWPAIDLGRIPKVKQRLDIKERVIIKVTPLAGRVPSTSIKVPKSDSGTSSSSDSEDEREIPKEKLYKEKIQIVATPNRQPTESQWPVINTAKVPKVKRRLDIKTTVPVVDMSSSSDSEDERVYVNVTPVGKLPSATVNVQKPDSGTSSSSESEDEQNIKIVTKENLQQIAPPAKQPSVESPWPVIDLVRIPKVKRRLDVKEKVSRKVTLVPERVPSTIIKIPKPESGTSSSSESEDEQKVKEQKLHQEKILTVTTPNRQPSESQWPVIDLVNVPKVKQRLDVKERIKVNVPLVPHRIPSTSIKVPKQDSGTSSSSESEDEREIKVRENLHQLTSPIKPPTALKPNQWPVVDLAKVPKVKHRLDIKTTVPTSDSSDSNSEDERVQVNVTQVQGRLPSTAVNVQKPESGTSSSSESEDEQQIKIATNNLHQIAPPAKQPSVDSPWPMIDLVRIPKVKRRLDVKEKVKRKVTLMPERVPSTIIKIPKPGSGTSSSSESEDEQKIKEQKLHQEKILTVTTPNRQPSESQWPVIDLVNVPKVKQRLDIKERIKVNVPLVPHRIPSTSIKVPKQDSGTSSSSESEDEREIKVKENLHQLTSPIKPPTALKPNQWPVVDLAKVPKVKHRLDIKTTVPTSDSSDSNSEDERVQVNVTQVQGRLPSTAVNVQKPESGTSSSSESEDEQQIKIATNNLHQIAPPAKQPSVDSPWPMIDLVRIPKVKRRLDVKEKVNRTVTLMPERVPSTIIKIPKPESGTSSSSESEDEREIKIATNNLQQIAPPAKQPSVESPWPMIDLVRIPKVKHRLDVKERVNVKHAPERVPSTSVKVPTPYSGTSSSSESEDEREIERNRENLQQTISPIKPPIVLTPYQESHWPVINPGKVPKLKRRLDLKTTVRASQSSSSDSEDEIVQVHVTQVQGKLPSTPVSVQKPQSGTSSSSESDEETPRGTEKPGLNTRWPMLDLKYSGKLKKRLDFKVISALPKLPSGSDSNRGVNINVTPMQERVSSTKSAQSSSSSSSEDERETTEVKKDNVLLITSPIKQPSGVSQWPVIDRITIPKLKQRLDIKEKVHGTQVSIIVPSATIKVTKSDSGTSSSSESEEEREIKIVNKENLPQITTKQPWPLVNLVTIPKLKRRLDIKERVKVTPVHKIIPSTSVKLPKSGSSSSSESEDGTIQKVSVTKIESRVEPQTQWPIVDPRGITRMKRRLDFKIPSRSPPLSIPSSGGSRQTIAKDHSSSSSSSDDEGNVVRSSQILVGQTTIKGPYMKPGLHESSSSSDDENGKPKISNVSVKSQDKHFIKASPMLSSPTKNTRNIELEKYKVVTDDLRSKSSSGSASPVTPELQSKWATMNLGVSRFRKRLDVTKTNSPSSPPPNSPKQDQIFTGFDKPYTKSIIVTERVATAPTRERNVDSSSSSSESEDDLKLDDKTSRVEIDFMSPQVSLSSIPKVKRSLNVTRIQKKSSSSSGDEGTVNMMVPDLRAGIPRVKRRLYIKAPTPPPSSSSSDDEKVYAHKFSDVTDQRSIEYKRTIMKSSSNDSFASNTQWQSHREPLYVGSNAQTPKKLSLDNIKRKLLPSKQKELPPNLRWTSVGSHLPEHHVPFSKRDQDVYTSPQSMSPPPSVPKHDSSDSSSSDDDYEKKEVETTLIVTQKTYNPRSGTFNRPTSPTILTAVNFEDGPERRGLSALKAMSSDRKNWDSGHEIFRESAPVSVDYHPEVQTVYRRTVDAKTKMSQAQSYSASTSSPASEERRLADMTYGIPSYRRHVIRSTEILEASPPPVPSTPLPEESPDFTWRSPQSSLSRGGYYNVQQKKTVEESVDEPFYDNPNISAV